MKIVFNRYTDDKIDEVSQDRVIVDYRDFNLNYGKRYNKSRLYPVPGGVYDSKFFGSIYNDTCNCGRVDTIGTTCNVCGCKVMTEQEKYERYARIDLDFYYVMDTKVDGLINFLKSLPTDFKSAIEYFEYKRLSRSSVFYLCELCQFDYIDGVIVANHDVTDDNKASYEGLLKIIEEHFPEKLTEYRTLINKKILVVPAAYRMVSFNPFEYRTHLTIPYLTSIYQSIVYLKQFIRDDLASTPAPDDRTLIRASFRRMLAKLPEEITSILNTSRENIARGVYSTRVGNSGRSVIVGDPDLKQDEVGLPISLAYELYKVDFISYLSVRYEITTSEAELMYRNALKTTLDIFKEYVYNRRVIMNRPPSLHRYNLMSFKVKVFDDAAIHFPILSVGSFNADYDGDALSFFSIPEEMNDYIDSQISPATQIRYESSNDFIYKPNHEMIYGLTLCTRVDSDPVSEDNYMTFEDIEDDYNNQTIQFPCDVILLNGKKTTYAYEKISKILGKPVYEILGNDSPITVKNISNILVYINSMDNHVDIYHDMVQFALEVVTIEGATIPSIAELIQTDMRGFTKELQDLAADIKNHPENLGIIDQKYQEFLAEQIKSIPTELRNRLEESNRIKMSQISEMFAPQMMINDDGSVFIADSSQAQGMSEKELRKQAMNNRQGLGLKQDLTPKGGYLARQIRFPSQGFRMDRTKSDPDNIGVYIPRNRAEGRTTVDGQLLGKSDSKELVLVRSVAVTKLNYFTPDMISEVYQTFQQGSNLGLKFGSAAAGDVTQTGLSLKHSAQVKRLDQTTKLIAPFDCRINRIRIDELEIYTSDGKTYHHYVPENFILIKNEVYKGEVIGYLDKFVTPEHAADMLIDLLGAKSSTDITRPHETEYSYNIAINSGRISYTKDYVMIDGRRMPRNPNRLYNKLEGTEVKAGDIICNGVLNTNVKEYCNSIQEYYSVFRSQLYALMPKFNEDMLEFVFSICHSWINEDLVYVGIKQKVKTDKSWFSQVSYEDARRLVLNTLSKPEGYEDKNSDLFGDFFLNLLNHRYSDENKD